MLEIARRERATWATWAARATWATWLIAGATGLAGCDGVPIEDADAGALEQDAGNALERDGGMSDPDNLPPMAVDQRVEVDAGGSVQITLMAIDPDSTGLTFEIVTPPLHGTLTGAAPTLTYAPALGFAGLDTLTFVASDGMLTSAPATVRIAVGVDRTQSVERIASDGAVVETYSGDGLVAQCAADVEPGQTCLVYPGTYPEWVMTQRGGDGGGDVTFLGFAGATMEGFRVRHPHVHIEGFNFHGYQVGLSPAVITVEPAGSDCTILNNHFQNGVHLNSRNLYFDAPSRTITNPDGGFLAAGFRPGARVYLASNINDLIANHDQVKRIDSVTDTTLTLTADETLITEGPVHSVIYATIQGKSGVQGILFTRSSQDGAASRCRIAGNRFTDLGGNAINVAGGYNVVENNVIEHMNGWRMFDVIGHHTVVRYNQVLDSPRYEGLEAPDGTGPDQSTGLYWDFVTTVILSIGDPTIPVTDNVFEYNYFEALDNEFVNVAEHQPNRPDVAEVGRFHFRHNVIVSLEMHGSFQQPESIVENNTFLLAAPESGVVFMVSGSERNGSADGSVVRNNAFVGCARPGRAGYGVLDAEMAEAPDHNYVAGGPETGFAAADAFDGMEAHGINGGDPHWVDIDNPLGPDGVPFTDDDGLRPAADSPLCGAGAQGADIGAYPCVR